MGEPAYSNYSDTAALGSLKTGKSAQDFFAAQNKDNNPAAALYAGSAFTSGNGNLVMVMAGFNLMNQIQNLTGSLNQLFETLQSNINTIAQNGQALLNEYMNSDGPAGDPGNTYTTQQSPFGGTAQVPDDTDPSFVGSISYWSNKLQQDSAAGNTNAISTDSSQLGAAEAAYNNISSEIQQNNTQATVPANTISSTITTLSSTDMQVTMSNITSASQGVGQQLSQLISSFQV